MAPDRETAARLLAAPDAEPPPDPLDADEPADVIVLGDLVIDRDRASVVWNGEPLELTHLEIEVLACLGRTPGRVWSYERLHRAAWHSDYLGDRDSLHSLIKRLRRKLRTADVAVDLHAVRGVGFQMMPLLSMTTWDLPV
jgi:DNA-binding response OmpR family regulator